jgi:hypothetical protein
LASGPHPLRPRRSGAGLPMASAYLGAMQFDDEDDEDDAPAPEMDLLVVLKLSNNQMGTNSERQQIEALADELAAMLENGDLGEYDGEELGGGECTLFFCGPDPDRLLAELRPVLKRSPLCRGAAVVRMVKNAAGDYERKRTML